MRIVATEIDLLELLRTFDSPDGWARPMDLGGSDGSNHSQVLTRMVERGLVERQERGGWTRKSYRYRLIGWTRPTP